MKSVVRWDYEQNIGEDRMKSVITGFITGLVLLSTGISSAAGVAVNGDLTLTVPGSGIVFPGGVKQTEAVTPDTYQKRIAAACNTGYAVTAIDPSGSVTCTPVDGNWLRSGSNISSTNTGNVGIGITTPTSRLTVAGTIETTSGGVKYPDGSIQNKAACRYEDNGDGTVSDCRTGLIWLKDANCKETAGGIVKSAGTLNWDNARTWSAALASGVCGLTDGSYAGDWRLPTKTEWMAMVAYAKSRYTGPVLTNAAGTAQWSNGDPFLNIQANNGYWSSSSGYITGSAWVVDTSNGYMFGYIMTTNGMFVWPVRAGQ
jgi:Protein of unknown function (DUF1566)